VHIVDVSVAKQGLQIFVLSLGYVFSCIFSFFCDCLAVISPLIIQVEFCDAELPPPQLLDCLSKELRRRLVISSVVLYNAGFTILIVKELQVLVLLIQGFTAHRELKLYSSITKVYEVSSLEQGLRLFNLDIIREGGAGNRYYVIDINYFPGKDF
jgi:hypothetical protein